MISIKLQISLLDLWKDNKVSKIHQELISTLLSAAKTIIASSWKDPNAISVSRWFNKIWELLIMDKIADSIKRMEEQQTFSNLLAKWSPFTGFIHLKEAIFQLNIKEYSPVSKMGNTYLHNCLTWYRPSSLIK
ncbi:UNVERIFIED_CONTAM: hypothetical protein K2H54_011111 [Gekko kuhli]